MGTPLRYGPGAALGMLALLGPLLAAAGQEKAAGRGPAAIERLLDDLGSRDWSVREDSQRQLLELPEGAIAALEDAALSADPEVALRAAYILEKIDPVEVRFRITRIRLGRPPAADPSITEVLEARAGEGDEVAAVPAAVSGSARDASRRFSIAHRTVPRGRLEIEVWKSNSGGGSPVHTAKPLEIPGAISLLDRGDEIFYLQVGSYMERRRQPFITLLECGRARRSGRALPAEAPAGERLPFRAGDSLESLIGHLRLQAAHPDADVRQTAIEILGWIGARDAIDLLREALRDPLTRMPALLALGRIGDEQGLEALRHLLGGAAGSRHPVLDADAPSPTGRPAATDRPASTDRPATTGRPATTDRPASTGRPALTDRPPPPSSTAAGTDAGGAAPGESFPALEAALILSAAGDPGAFEHLLTALEESDPTMAPRLLAALSDRIENAGDPSLAEMLIEHLGSDRLLEKLPWHNLETEHLYAAAIGRLDPSSPRHRDLAGTMLRNLAANLMEQGDIGATQLRSFLIIWDTVSRRFSTRDLMVEILGRFIAGVRDPSQLASISAWISRAFQLEPLPDDVFGGMMQALRDQIRPREPGRESTAIALLLQISRNLALVERQLGTLVELLLEAASGPRRYYQTELLGEIQRLTGLPDILPIRRPGTALTALSTAVEKARPRVEKWLADAEAVRESYRRLQGAAAGSAPGGAGERLEFLEVNVLRRPRDGATPAPGGSIPAGGRMVSILDGRRLFPRAGEPASYQDRWGNASRVRIDPLPPAVPGGPKRYQLSTGGVATEGIPILTSPREKEMRVGWYETTESQLGIQPIASSAEYRLWSVIMVLPRPAAEGEDGGGEKPGARDGAGQEAGALWGLMVKRLTDAIPALVDEGSIQMALQFVRELGVEEALPALRGLFERLPRIDVAQILMESGDRSAIAFLHKELEEGAAHRRLQAAQLLTEAGDRRGLEALLDLLAKKSPGTNAYMALEGLDRFLLESAPTPEERRRILDHLISNLNDFNYQARTFSILLREAGTDFGYGRTWSISLITERRQAQSQAIEAARRWWEDQRRIGK